MGDNWSTPDPLFQKFHNEFQFNLDACASLWNHKCANYYTEEDNALEKDWEGSVWMNPPYSGNNLEIWMTKAHEECYKWGSKIVCLVPSRTETNWYHKYCLGHEIRPIRGRINFEDKDGKSGRPRFGCVLVIMRPFKYDSYIRSVIQPKGLKIN